MVTGCPPEMPVWAIAPGHHRLLVPMRPTPEPDDGDRQRLTGAPHRVPAGEVSNELVHEADLFTTLVPAGGGRVPG
jgi:hypothetical protein